MFTSLDESGAMTEYETILVETRGRVGWITLNRPDALNALNTQVCRDVVAAAAAFDADEQIGAIVVTGSDRAFAAGPGGGQDFSGVINTIRAESAG